MTFIANILLITDINKWICSSFLLFLYIVHLTNSVAYQMLNMIWLISLYLGLYIFYSIFHVFLITCCSGYCFNKHLFLYCYRRHTWVWVISCHIRRNVFWCGGSIWTWLRSIKDLFGITSSTMDQDSETRPSVILRSWSLRR